MQILGISNGTLGGNSEILLKVALTSAAESNNSIRTSWIHAPSILIPRNPKALEGAQDVSQGFNSSMLAGKSNDADLVDDRRAILNAVLDADALIFSTPVYSHSPAGFLKAALDRVLGPFTDVVFATKMLELQAAGDPQYKDVSVDQRLLKPRVAGFLAVGGSTTPDQFTLALPLLHLMVYPLHAKVVDQAVFMGCGAPGSVVSKDNGAVLERGKQLGRNLASQLGKAFDEALYLGPEPSGACPYCHLAKFELLNAANNEIGCTTCGALGKLVVSDSGTIKPIWNEDCQISSLTWAGKLTHIADLKTNGANEIKEIHSDPEFEVKKQYWRDLELPRVQLPSLLGKEMQR